MSVDLEKCVGSRTHRPAVITTDRHHVYPKYLCALLELKEIGALVPLCKTEHDNIHHVIDHLINEGEAGGHVLSLGATILVNACWDWYQEVLLREKI
jgi:hypothetical protein